MLGTASPTSPRPHSRVVRSRTASRVTPRTSCLCGRAPSQGAKVAPSRPSPWPASLPRRARSTRCVAPRSHGGAMAESPRSFGANRYSQCPAWSGRARGGVGRRRAVEPSGRRPSRRRWPRDHGRCCRHGAGSTCGLSCRKPPRASVCRAACRPPCSGV